jgi:hypothetical protein
VNAAVISVIPTSSALWHFSRAGRRSPSAVSVYLNGRRIPGLR